MSKEKIYVMCTCKNPGRISPDIHEADCEYAKALRSKCYPELIGNKSRGSEIPPVDLPNICPVCGAEVSIKEDGEFAKRIYACGGTYEMKPQIQNHTDYFWGTCGDFDRIEKNEYVRMPENQEGRSRAERRCEAM